LATGKRRAWIGLGSNLGDRAMRLARALDDIEDAGHHVVAVSSVWETEPVGVGPQPWFLNMAAEIVTDSEPLVLLDDLLAIERRAGRTREIVGAARTLDLDLLAVDGAVLDHPRLILPHPRMWERRFVLGPLSEIAPGFRNPATGRTALEELEQLPTAPVARRAGRLAPGGSLVL
jgi:2-amino-4-hydroxy-6-hydroxymethyldihydropteridine diphosphokinase